MTFFSSAIFKRFSTNTAEQIQPENVPFLGVYFINEDMVADGDANVGEVRFRSTATYGLSVVVQNNDAAAAENTLDAAWIHFSIKRYKNEQGGRRNISANCTWYG